MRSKRRWAVLMAGAVFVFVCWNAYVRHESMVRQRRETEQRAMQLAAEKAAVLEEKRRTEEEARRLAEDAARLYQGDSYTPETKPRRLIREIEADRQPLDSERELLQRRQRP